MFKQSGNNVVLTLDASDARRVLRLIRARQDDINKVTEEYSNYEQMRELGNYLEVLKMRIANQF